LERIKAARQKQAEQSEQSEQSGQSDQPKGKHETYLKLGNVIARVENGRSAKEVACE
jgi:hypothetical protein